MRTTIDTAQVSLPSDRQVRVVRDFQAPRDLVWEAHTDPKLVKRWMLGPPGWSMPVCEMDVRTGGTYLWRWRSDTTGQVFGFHGDYHDVDTPSKIIHAEYYDPGDLGGAMDVSQPAIIDTRFTEKDGVTSLVMIMEFATKEIRDAAVSTGMTDGMEMGYQRLDKMFAEQMA